MEINVGLMKLAQLQNSETRTLFLFIIIFVVEQEIDFPILLSFQPR